MSDVFATRRVRLCSALAKDDNTAVDSVLISDSEEEGGAMARSRAPKRVRAAAAAAAGGADEYVRAVAFLLLPRLTYSRCGVPLLQDECDDDSVVPECRRQRVCARCGVLGVTASADDRVFVVWRDMQCAGGESGTAIRTACCRRCVECRCRWVCVCSCFPSV